MKVIFLDIDGVLNTANYQGWRQIWGLKTSDKHGCLFSPRAVRNLRRLLKWTDAKIVISSSWRLRCMEEMELMWVERKMPGRIYDLTPYMYGHGCDYANRGFEIDKWLHENHATENPFVILDDRYDFLPHQRPNAIITNYRRGLTLWDVLKARIILNNRKHPLYDWENVIYP